MRQKGSSHRWILEIGESAAFQGGETLHLENRVPLWTVQYSRSSEGEGAGGRQIHTVECRVVDTIGVVAKFPNTKPLFVGRRVL